MKPSDAEQNFCYDVVVVGAGFAGLYALKKFRDAGYHVTAIEAGGDVGGTWYWNRYPGARCDVESMQYCYTFDADLQKEWTWSERYAAQPEIRDYANHVADRFALRPDIRFETRVLSAQWDDDAHLWTLATDAPSIIRARYCIMATGVLSEPKLPDIAGLSDFGGTILHTAQWPEQPVDFAGKQVGLIGTGSSGIQILPILAEKAKSLTVFQRTPSFAVPANNSMLSPEAIAEVRDNYPALLEKARASFLGFFGDAGPGSACDDSEEQRQAVFEKSWNAGTTGLLQSYSDLLLNETSNGYASEFARGKIRQLVHDADTAKRITPVGYPIGARRLCSEIGYYDALNRDTVELIDVRETPIERITASGIKTSAGDYPLDVIVLATGFHAMVGALSKIEIKGAQGRLLSDEWGDGPRTYLGLMVSGFPNLFTVTGPGSPSVLGNVIYAIEQHVEWIFDCISFLSTNGKSRIEATEQAEDAWMEHCDALAQSTLLPRANTWYQSRTRDGKLVFMPYTGGVGTYRAKCQEIAEAGYEGFLLGSATQNVAI